MSNYNKGHNHYQKGRDYGVQQGYRRQDNNYSSQGPQNRQMYKRPSYGPTMGSNHYSHKPKLEDDYRNKNIHKFKRLQGSNVMSPRTERLIQNQQKQFIKSNQRGGDLISPTLNEGFSDMLQNYDYDNEE